MSLVFPAASPAAAAPFTTGFEAARTTAYQAFSQLPHRPDMARCPHCVSAGDVAELGRPTPEIPAETVARFLRKAGTTWGGETEVRRLAPRVLHLAADHQLPVHRSVAWTAWQRSGWPHWPAPEVAAVSQFLVAEWQRLLAASARPGLRAHAWLAQIAPVAGDLSPYLTAWTRTLADPTDEEVRTTAVSHLVELLTNSALRPDVRGSLAGVFPEQPEATEQVSGWLASAETELLLNEATKRLAGTAVSRRTDTALARLQRFSRLASS